MHAFPFKTKEYRHETNTKSSYFCFKGIYYLCTLSKCLKYEERKIGQVFDVVLFADDHTGLLRQEKTTRGQ